MPHQAPWELEERLLDLPLNLAGNRRHPFAPQLSALRTAAKARAALFDVAPGRGAVWQ